MWLHLTTFRQPVLEGLGWVTHWFYLPLALAIPTPQMLVHTELNFIYQFLIHTELLGDFGVLGNVLNTASHHRVHHGANRSGIIEITLATELNSPLPGIVWIKITEAG